MPELKPDNSHSTKRVPAKKKAVVLAVSILIAVASIVVTAFLGHGTYIVASVIVAVCAIVPFLFAFESSATQARELACVAMMCVIAIASRAIFAPIPFFKPIAGVVMIAGMAFGPVSGFTVGSVSMLVSNFMFGQGPWTPWQMLAFGLCGAVAGLFSRRTSIRTGHMSFKTRLALSVFCGVFYLVIAGPILDTSSVFFMLSRITPEGVGAVYLAGVPVNAIQATATALTVFLFANVLLRKIESAR